MPGSRPRDAGTLAIRDFPKWVWVFPSLTLPVLRALVATMCLRGLRDSSSYVTTGSSHPLRVEPPLGVSENERQRRHVTPSLPSRIR